MALTEDQFHLFETAAEGRLSAGDQHDFDNQLLVDPSLRAEWNAYTQFRHSLESIPLKQQLDAIYDQLNQQGVFTTVANTATDAVVRPLPKPGSRWWPAAVAAIFLVVSGVWLWRGSPTPASTQPVFTAFYRPEPIIRGAGDCSATLTPVIDQYRRGQYQPALTSLGNRPADACSAYYRGLCLLALNKPEQATESLSVARQQSSGSLQQRAEWYLALSYMATNDRVNADRQLHQITRQATHPFGPVARQALALLDNE